jgi:phage terminase large subunit
MINITIPDVFKELFQPKRYKCFYGGRGGAKSHAFARALIVMGMQKKMRIVCAREIQKNIKASVHTLIADIIRTHELTYFYEIQEAVIKGKNGTEIMFSGLKHNSTGIKSLEGSDVWWVEEAENVSASSWEILIPTVRKEGSEIWVSFNTKNISDPTYQNFVARQSDDILCKKVSWRDNPYFPEVLNKERLRLEKEDPEAYAHIWEGEPDTRKSGVVYAKEMAKAREEGRICSVPYDPAFEVFTAWDLGYGKGNATSIWFLQFVGRELRWLEYYEAEGEFIPHFAEVIKSRPYNYMAQGHYLPHDGAAANVRGASVPQQLSQLGIQTTVLPRASNELQIAAERESLSAILAYSVFDEKKTKDGVFALETYHFKWDEERGKFSNKPYHDWSSNPADAARYAAVAVSKVKNQLIKPKELDHVYNRGRKTSWMG